MNCRSAMGVVAGAFILLGSPAAAPATMIEPDVLTDGIATNNNCTLREAVQAANENLAIDDCPAGSEAETDRIFLDSGHYTLTIDGHDAANLEGDIDADVSDGALVIRGAGMNSTFIDSEMDDRVIEKPFSGDLTLWDLTLDGPGYQDLLGGGVLRAAGFGDTVVDSVAIQGGDAQFGGGIQCSFCTLELTDSIVRNNQATAGSTGFPNVAARGGGIELSSAVATITRTTILSNEAIANDSIAEGGGLDASGTVRIRSSAIRGNAAFSSTDSTAASSRRMGAGILADGDGTKVKITNSTISQNAASSNGHASSGGGIQLEDDAKLTVQASTIGNNNASTGTAITALGGRATVQGSILSSFSANVSCNQAGGSIRSKGYNVLDLDPGACLGGAGSDSDLVEDPLIGAISLDNGGPTQTYQLPDGSPALNFVPKKKCRAAGKEDQRGAERPAGKRCDAGSYERVKCRGSLVGFGFTFGTPGDDNMSGLAGADLLAPSAGDDKYNGFAGADRLCGGTGNDNLKGGEDDDLFDGGKGTDRCDGGPGSDSGKSCERAKSL